MTPSVLLAFALAAVVLGGMLFFLAVIAPTVFRAFDGQNAARFVRAMFPLYYVVLGGVSALAALSAAAGGRSTAAVLLALIALGFAGARWGLMPRINALRDRATAGDGDANKRFHALHRASVGLNAIQMIGLVASAALLAR